ncbi:MAG: hypothetical protein ACKVP7_25060 [Hyphomicrobiaceae bacterium]
MGAVVIALTYFLITALCVAMSAISTFYGYETMLGTLTLPFTVVVAAGLFACDISILDRRSKGLSIIGPAFVLLVFTALSAASNFNYFYSREMRKDLAAERLATATLVFENNMKAAETLLRGQMQLPAIRSEIEKERSNLANEVQNEKKGFGQKANTHIENIRVLLRRIPREIVAWTPPPPPANEQRNKAALVDFNRIVDEALTFAEKEDPWSKGLAEIDLARKDQVKVVAKSSALDILDPAAADVEAVKEIGLITQRVDRSITSIFELQKKPRTSLAMVPTRTEGVQLNNIMASLKSGFIERPDIGKTAFAAAAAVLVDLLPLIFALVLVRPTRKPRGAASDEPEEDVSFVAGPRGAREPVRRPEILGKDKQPALRKVKG